MWNVFSANTIAEQALFQTGWFMVGLVTQTLVVSMVRTRKLPFIDSRPSLPVVLASLAVILTGVLIVSTPLASFFEFTTLPANYWLWFAGIVIAYLLTLEGAKRIYIRVTGEWL